jgi:hypothetical protein
MNHQFKIKRNGFIERMRRFPECQGRSIVRNEVPLTKGNLTLYNSEDRVMQVMPFRSRNERKELFKRAHNIKGVASIGLVFYSS